jgi:hypothetical protein|tara:strand:+ start:4360 stop:4677 length:318 start_codon:yes stop_codon:yes gene_type:complete
MKKKEYLDRQVDATFKVLEAIEKVPVNHFFKHKVLQKIQAEQHLKQPIITWFTPQFQLVTLVVILVLNASVIFYSFSNVKEISVTNIMAFAQEYSLQSRDSFILN